MRLRCPILVLLALILLAGVARADRLVLRNGQVIRGEILSETEQEVVIAVGDGMKMSLRRALIEKIEREEKPPEPEPAEPEPAKPDEPAPEKPAEPEAKPPVEAEPEPDAKPLPNPAALSDARWFENTPQHAWQSKLGRYPEVTVAKLTRFHAYRLVERAPLRNVSKDPWISRLAAKYGHGGSIARWTLKFAGTLELRYGDKVKFLGEIRSHPSADPPLIRLMEGPTTSTYRTAVFLLKRRTGGYERYATTTVFGANVFRQESLRALGVERVPVRTYDEDFGILALGWISPKELKFLEALHSPFGESPTTRVERYRFRLEWFRTPKNKRPALDPALINDKFVHPFAKKGRPVASEEFVRKMWGSEKTAAAHLEAEIRRVREALARLGIKPGKGYRIEWERIGMMDNLGVTIRTKRLRLTKTALRNLTRPAD